MRRLLIIGLLGVLALFAAAPAFAADDEAEPVPISEEVTDTGAVNVGDPALEVEISPEQEADVPAWTYRFLIPTLIALTVVVVAITVIQYFNQVVKARYRPVE
jgi:hypothetical protein